MSSFPQTGPTPARMQSDFRQSSPAEKHGAVRCQTITKSKSNISVRNSEHHHVVNLYEVDNKLVGSDQRPRDISPVINVYGANMKLFRE